MRFRRTAALALLGATAFVASYLLLSRGPFDSSSSGDAPGSGESLALRQTDESLASRETASRGEGAESSDAEGSRWSQIDGDGLPIRAPNPWFFLERAYPFGRINRAAWQQAQLDAAALKAQGGPRSVTWEFRGPTNIGGRITDLAVHPANADIVYAGAAEGGILKTTNGGQLWTAIFDDQPSLAIGALAIDPSDPLVVYAGTGEVNPGGGSVAYGGTGIYRSTDAGTSWQPIGLEATGSIGRIRVDPTNPQRIYVAAMGNLWETGPDRGIYRTTDGGASWEKVFFLSDSTGCVDLILRPDQPQTLFAAMWERIRRPEAYHYGGATCGVYKSTDGGDTWSLAGGGLPAPSSNLGRIGLSLSTGQPDVMHAVYADRIGYFAGLYRSTNGGASWARTNDGALSGVFASYGWWFGNCRTHPTNPNTIFVLGLDFYRSTNGGTSWSEASGGMHVDHHALEFGPGSSPVIWEGNDGGIYRSTNGGSAWTLPGNQPITQIYRVALDPNNPAALYAGAQDNGTIRTQTGALNDWQMIYGGDGFQPMVHPQSSSRIWAQYQYGNLVYSSNGGSGWSGATSGISSGDRRNWNTAVRIDPTNPNRYYFGTQRLYRSTNGTSWAAISPDLTGGAGGSQGQVYGTLTTIAVSPLDGQVIWTGSDDAHVQVTTNGGTNWTDVSGTLPDRWVTSVRASAHVRETAFVTISGLRWAEPLPHVLRTTDLGATWTPIASNLPEAPANDLIEDPDAPTRLWVATDVGVFETVDGGASWHAFGDGLPNVVITSLAFDPGARVLVAGTYGRSFFSAEVGTTVDVAEGGSESGDGDSGGGGVPGAIAGRLLAPVPNPASDRTTLSWALASPAGSVEIEVIAVSGRRVWHRRIDGAAADGRLVWDLREESGRRVAAGTYYCRLSAGGAEIGREVLTVLR